LEHAAFLVRQVGEHQNSANGLAVDDAFNPRRVGVLPVATFRNYDIDVVRLGLRDDAPEHLQRPNGLKIPKCHLDGALFTGGGDAANVAVVFQGFVNGLLGRLRNIRLAVQGFGHGGQ